MSAAAGATTARLVALLERMAGRIVWVLGDVMLDEYIYGMVERISPEAPVPVVRAAGGESRLGGAANVARQVTALGAHARLAGVVGADAAAETLARECRAAGVDTCGLVPVAGRPTTRKQRILGHGQQLARVDWEDATPCSMDVARELVARLAGGPRPDVVILSDYAKGTLTAETLARILSVAHDAGVPVLVDPKRLDFAAYRGATVVTPNLRELEAAAGRGPLADLAAISAAARAVTAASGFGAMVVTLGERGMLVVPGDGAETALAAVRHEVYDVTGAGDTAIAVLALGLAAGGELGDAARLANVAAGLSVGQVGTVAIGPAALRDALAPAPVRKLLARDELGRRAAEWRTAGRRIVFTNGCFDLLHAGHLSLLHEAAALGDVLLVAINSDASVRRLKGPQRPLVEAAERAALLAALACVDAVTVFDEDTPLESIRAVLPDVLVKGQDYRVEDVVGREVVEAAGGRVALVALQPERSTSSLVERIRGRS